MFSLFSPRGHSWTYIYICIGLCACLYITVNIVAWSCDMLRHGRFSYPARFLALCVVGISPRVSRRFARFIVSRSMCKWAFTHKARNEKSLEKINRSQYISHCSITYEAKARSVNLRQSEISPQNPTGAVFSEKFARDFSTLTNQRVCCCVCCVAVKSTWLIHVAFGLFFIHCTICPVVLWLSG